MNQSVNETHDGPPRRVLVETLLVFVVTIVLQTMPSLSQFAVLVPVVYLVVELRVRDRSWIELGFDLHGLGRALARTWPFILWVAIVNQLVPLWVGMRYWPELLQHIVERSPVLETPLGLLLLIALAAFGEELIFRAFFQERLSWFIGAPLSIAVVSVVFGLAHWAQGDLAIVAVDVGLVTLDGVFYGLVFARSRNIYAAWIAHFLANLVGMSGLLLR